MEPKTYDFSGWATRNDLKCSDGRTIRHNAFRDCDGVEVPLVWNHSHGSPDNVLGHALLENRDEGVYCYGTFNDTSSGQVAKVLVQHGDITSLSIYANQLKQVAGDVVHGVIREVSLVHAGANPGAYIETVIAHSDDADEEAVVYTGMSLSLTHAEEPKPEAEPVKEEEEKEGEPKMASEKTVKDVFDELTEDQKKVVYGLIGQALADAGAGEGENMKHNAFDGDYYDEGTVMAHSEIDMETIFNDAKRCGSLKDSVLAHAQEYGIENIEYLFPDARTIGNEPDFISRDMEWVSEVINGTHHTPFSRIKSIHANITAEEARAKGYLKGNKKKDEVFTLLKRTTTPTTIYKKQKMDRDDLIDITDLNVVAWIKKEMRMMLNEEIARAILIGDGRLGSSDDKINESNIRPIVSDDDLYAVKIDVTGDLADDYTLDAAKFIDTIIRSRKEYKGSGNPTLFTTEDVLTEMLLLKDGIGHRLYKTEAELATALRVKKITTVEVMEDFTDADGHSVFGILVNLNDYNVGADKGGEVNMFDDFDIDYNQQKYLMETRCSGALVKPFSALVFRAETMA